MINKTFLVFLILVVAVMLIALACQPAPPNSGTSSTTTSTTRPPATTTSVPSAGSNTENIQTILDNVGRIDITQPVVSNGTIKPPAGSTINFLFDGELIRDSSATRAAVDVSEPNVTINNLKVRGSNPCAFTYTQLGRPAAFGQMYSRYEPTKEEQAALYTRDGARNLRVNGVTANDVWGDAVTFLGGEDMKVTNVNGRCLGRSGVSVVSGSDIEVTGGSISGAFWWGLNIEPNTPSRSVSNVKLTGMNVGFTRYPWLSATGPDFNCQVFNVDARGNSLQPGIANTGVTIRGCVAGQIRY